MALFIKLHDTNGQLLIINVESIDMIKATIEDTVVHLKENKSTFVDESPTQIWEMLNNKC